MFRRTQVLLQLGAGLLVTITLGAQTSSDLFDDSKLQDIKLTVTADDWAALRQNFLENTYYPAGFAWNDINLQIGIRSRGRGSRSGEKPNLYLNFDRIIKKQRFLGLEAVNLNGNNQDASVLHTLISFKLFARSGLPTPRLAMARLFVNDEYFGLYNLVENIDEHFLDRNFGESSGFLYEYEPNRIFNFDWLGSDPALYSPNLFEPANHEDDPDPQPFVDMMSAINFSSGADFIEAVSAHINPELYLTHAAIENVLTEIDGVLGGVYGMNNFNLYRFKDSQLSQMIVWDKDLTFGQPDRAILAGVESNVLARRLLAIPKYRSIYINALVVAATAMGGKGGWADREVTRFYDLVHAAAIADPHKQCINAGVIYSCGPAQFEQGIQEMRAFIASRSSFVLGEVLALPPLEPAIVPSVREVKSAAPHPGSDALAPGSLASLWGTGFGDAISSPNVPLPRVLDDVFISIDGVRVPLMMISPEQINFQIPWETSTGGAFLTVSRHGQLSNAIAVEIAPAAPAVFSVSHSDGTLVTSDAPAAQGETLTVWATGLGPVREPVESGRPAPDKSSPTNEATLISVGGIPCAVIYSGLAPGWVGLYQVDFELSGDVPAGSTVPLDLTTGGYTAKIDLNTK